MSTFTLPRLEPFQGLLQIQIPCPGGVQGQGGPGASWAMDGMSFKVLSTPKQCGILALCGSLPCSWSLSKGTVRGAWCLVPPQAAAPGSPWAALPKPSGSSSCAAAVPALPLNPRAVSEHPLPPRAGSPSRDSLQQC